MRKIIPIFLLLANSVLAGVDNPTDLSGYVSVTADSATNRVAKTGDTISGAILSTASSALTAPANDELPSAGWVRGLFDSGDFQFFASTTSAINSAYGNFVTETQAVLFSKSVASVTNTQYAISGMTTQRFSRVQGPMFCNAWMRQIDNGAVNSLSCHPEFYYTYDGTNLLGDYEAPTKTISTANTTNFYDWIVPFPSVVSTSAAGFYVVARMKVDVAVNAGMEIVGGYNRRSSIGFTVPALNNDPTKLDSNTWATANSTTNFFPQTGGTVTGNLFNVNTTFAGVTNGSYWTYYSTTQAVYTVYVGTNLWNLTFTP